MTVELARRTMKARRGSICPACRAPVAVGQRIGLVDAGWCHITCILAAAERSRTRQCLRHVNAEPMTRTRARRPMERERCNATRRDGQRCQAPAVKGAAVCRRHGGAAPQVKRNADQLAAIWEVRAALPYLQKWTDELVGEYRHSQAVLAEGDRRRRCKARRKNGQPCRNWAIRGGFVCRIHGGAAPQVRAKARVRAESARIYREVMAARRRSLASRLASRACLAGVHAGQAGHGRETKPPIRPQKARARIGASLRTGRRRAEASRARVNCGDRTKTAPPCSAGNGV